MEFLSLGDFNRAREQVKPHVYHTPLLTLRILSERTGFDIRLKAEMFQRTGSYKIRGPLNKFSRLSKTERDCGISDDATGQGDCE